MRPVYLYLHHCDFDFFLSDHLLTKEEAYCPDCEESNELIGIYYNEEVLNAKIQELQKAGLDFIPE
jgi:hypothetical protein